MTGGRVPGGIESRRDRMSHVFARYAPTLRPSWLALALLALLACSACSGGGDAPAKSLVLISLDTLRADRLGVYGYERDTSPAIDALAVRGARFGTVIAESNWTLPSHVTLMTGQPPQLHGVTIPNRAPAADLPLLAEVLRDHGFRTIGLTAGRFLTRRYHFDRGFEQFDDGDLSFGRALASARERLAALDPDERFFLFLHTYDVHCPYDPPEAYARRFTTRPPADHVPTRGRCGNPHFNRMQLTPGQARFISDRYDAGIRYADDLLGEFLAELDRTGRLESTLVVVVSDHGEEFMEHGKVGHRGTLHIQSLRIPWVMAGPGVPAVVVEEPVGLADVMPTLLELLGVPTPPLRGESKLALLRGERDADVQRIAFSQNDWGPLLYSAIVGDRQIIVNYIRGTARIYDWRADPEGQVVRARENTDAEPDRALRVAARDEFLRRRNDPERRDAVSLSEPSADERAQLEALGYVDP